MSTLKEIPHFKTEDEEREFWATHSFLDYIDLSTVKETEPPMVPKSENLFFLKLSVDDSRKVKRIAEEKSIPAESLLEAMIHHELQLGQRGIAAQ